MPYNLRRSTRSSTSSRKSLSPTPSSSSVSASDTTATTKTTTTSPSKSTAPAPSKSENSVGRRKSTGSSKSVASPPKREDSPLQNPTTTSVVTTPSTKKSRSKQRKEDGEAIGATSPQSASPLLLKKPNTSNQSIASMSTPSKRMMAKPTSTSTSSATPRRKKDSYSPKKNGGAMQPTTNLKRNLAIFLGLVLVAGLGVLYFFSLAPPASNNHCQQVMTIQYLLSGVLPTFLGGKNDKMSTVKELWLCTSEYQKVHPFFTIVGFVLVYVTLQAFAIPGAIVLSILGGAIYPFVYAQLLIAFCATTGASICFFISYLIGKDIVNYFFPTMLANFRKSIANSRDNLMWYMLFLRLTPLLPNWFVNIACPIVQVDFKYFFFATLIGLVPGNLIHATTGLTLHKAAQDSSATASEDASGLTNGLLNFGILFLLQFVALLPTLFKSKLKKMQQSQFGKDV